LSTQFFLNLGHGLDNEARSRLRFANEWPAHTLIIKKIACSAPAVYGFSSRNPGEKASKIAPCQDKCARRFAPRATESIDQFKSERAYASPRFQKPIVSLSPRDRFAY
jgi:hypothetical protein